MFSGLVEAKGTLSARVQRGPGYELEIATAIGPLEIGESVSVSGVCLTVTEVRAGGFAADVTVETLDRSTLGQLELGAQLNLERSLRLGDRLGGHLVSGHVDGVVRVEATTARGDALEVGLELPAELAAYVAPKGSVVLDGVSLTVNRVEGRAFSVMLIPHTLEVTNLGALRAGSLLNLEVDLLARYVVNYLRSAGPEQRHA